MHTNSLLKSFLNKLLGLIAFVILTLSSYPLFTQAQSIRSLQVIPGINNIGDLINVAQAFLVSLATPVTVLVIAYGGYQYFLGANDEGKTNGRKTIQAGITGLIIVLMADAITGLVRSVFTGNASRPIDAGPLIAFINDQLIGNLTLLAVGFATLAMIWGGYKDFIKAFDDKTSGIEAVKVSLFGISVIFLAGAFANVVKTSLTGTTNLGDGITKLVGAFTPIFQSTTGLLTVLSVVIAALVIAKGGFDYYVGAAGGKAKGIETIQKGVFGLTFSLLSGFIANLVADIFGKPDNITKLFDFTTLPTTSAGIIGAVLNKGIDFLLVMASIFAVAVIAYGGYQFFIAALPDSKVKGLDSIRNGVIGLIVVILARPIVTIIQQTLAITDSADVSEYSLTFDPASILNLLKGLLANLLIPLSSIVAIFFFILGAYLWITSNGDSKQVEKARNSITNAIIGLIVALMCTTIVQLIIYFVQPGEFIEPDANTAGQSFSSS